MKFVPTSRLVALLVVPLGLAAATPFVPTLTKTMVALDAAIFALALMDALTLLRNPLSLHRRVPRVLSLGRDNPVTLEVRSQAKRPLRVWLKDDVPDSVEPSQQPLQLTLPALGRAEVVYHLRPTRRGAYELGDQHARYASVLGLWMRQIRRATRDPIRVYPDVRAVRTYDLLAKQNREALLARAARLRGGENEFERLRDHLRDDPYRAIDWKATARRQRLTVKEYQKERDQTVICLLDCGRLMTAESDGISHFDHALNASLMLAHVAARTGDQVGLLAFDHRVRAFSPPASGARATRQLINAVYDLHPELVETDYGCAFEALEQRMRKRALVVMFTQVVDDVGERALVRHMRALPGRHLPLCVLFRDDDIQALADAALPGGKVDLKSLSLHEQAAAAETVLWRERVVGRLKTSGVFTLHTPAAKLTPALVNRYLEIKARQLL